MKTKLKKSDWLPSVILIYFLTMTVIFAPELIQKGEWIRLVTVFFSEILIIILLRIFLKKREQQKK